MPLFMVKKEVYGWLKEGKKSIDVRKGNLREGDIAVFQCGANYLHFRIVRKETGKLDEVITAENYKQVIPTAESQQAALDYLRGIYGESSSVFTAYYLANPKSN